MADKIKTHTRQVASRLLPEDAREALQRAATADATIPIGESPLRIARIDRTVRGIKEKYPRYFKREEE